MGSRSSDNQVHTLWPILNLGLVFWDIDGRTASSGAMNQPKMINILRKPLWFRSPDHTREQLSLSFVDETDQSWLPCLKNMEKNHVTDRNKYSLTVTIKESFNGQRVSSKKTDDVIFSLCMYVVLSNRNNLHFNIISSL